VLVLGDAGTSSLDEAVRNVATSFLPGPLITSIENQRSVASPVVSWIQAGQVVATLVLGIACLLALIDRIIGTGRQLDHLRKLGISPGQLRTHRSLTFAVPYALACAVGFVGGVAICLVWVGTEVPFPSGAVAAAALSAGIVGALATTAVASLGGARAEAKPQPD
jgi:hypothetical protein